MMLDIKMYSLPLIWLESWSRTIKEMIEENSRTTDTMRDKSHGLIGQKQQNTFQ